VSSLTKAVLVALLLTPALGLADEPAKTPKITLSGLVDSYYTVNLNQSQSYTSPSGGYSAPTGFNLNFAKVAALAELDPVAFHLELGFGPEGQAITAVPGGGTDVFVEQAYASLKFGTLTLEAGRFVTPAGFEVYEANNNWLYTKGLLFQFAVPTAHVGARLVVPVSEALTATLYLVNGSDLWTNDVGHTSSPYKTVAAALTYSNGDTAAAANVFYADIPGTAAKSAFLIDANVAQTMGALSLDLAGDYGSAYDTVLLKNASWAGVALSGKYALTPVVNGVARLEYLSDKDGIHTGTVGLAPAKSVTSATAGASYAVGTNASLRAELRWDKASEKVYRGDDSMASLTVAALAWF
jgi:hypothetical protein